MSQEHGNARPAGDLPDDEGKQAHQPLRTGGSAQEQTSADMDPDPTDTSGNTWSSKKAADVGFQGLADEADAPPKGAHEPVDDEVQVGWERKLEREGKLNPEAKTVRDVVLGSSEPKE